MDIGAVTACAALYYLGAFIFLAFKRYFIDLKRAQWLGCVILALLILPATHFLASLVLMGTEVMKSADVRALAFYCGVLAAMLVSIRPIRDRILIWRLRRDGVQPGRQGQLQGVALDD